eukprot:tig00021012_g16985.t1
MERARKRARPASASASTPPASAAAAGHGRSIDIEPRLDALPDDLLEKIIDKIGLRDVLLCRPHQVCRRLRKVTRSVIWDELDLAPSETEIRAVESGVRVYDVDSDEAAARAQLSANHMRRLKSVLASLHPAAGFAAWGQARALRIRFSASSFVSSAAAAAARDRDADDDIAVEEAYTTINIVSSLARASPTITTARVEFGRSLRNGGCNLDRRPRISVLLAALAALPRLTRLELGGDGSMEKNDGAFSLSVFSWTDLISNKDGILTAVLASFSSLKHISFPFHFGARHADALGALPSLCSLGITVPVGQLGQVSPRLLDLAEPRLERTELRLVRPGAYSNLVAIDDAPASALEALAGSGRAVQIVRKLEIEMAVMHNLSFEGAGRFFDALARFSGLESLSLKVLSAEAVRRFWQTPAFLARLINLKEVSISIADSSQQLEIDSRPLADALASIRGLAAIDLQMSVSRAARELADRLRPKLRRCNASVSEKNAGGDLVAALAALQPWEGLTVAVHISSYASRVPLGEQPRVLRSLARALASAGHVELRLCVESEADFACLGILAPLGPRVRPTVWINVPVPTAVDSYERNREERERTQSRLRRSAQALLRGCFAQLDR